jgi:hypothetical protein
MIHIDTTLLSLLLIVTAIAKEQAIPDHSKGTSNLCSRRICFKYKRWNKNSAARKLSLAAV